MGLEEYFDVAEFGEVELSLVVQLLIFCFQLLDLPVRFLVGLINRTVWFQRWSLHFGLLLVCWNTFHLVQLSLGCVSCTSTVYFLTACDVVQILVFASLECVVTKSWPVFIEEGFQPLAKLQVVLILRILELFNINVSLHSIFIKSRLKNLIILNELMLMFSLPLNPVKRKSIRVKTV